MSRGESMPTIDKDMVTHITVVQKCRGKRQGEFIIDIEKERVDWHLYDENMDRIRTTSIDLPTFLMKNRGLL